VVVELRQDLPRSRHFNEHVQRASAEGGHVLPVAAGQGGTELLFERTEQESEPIALARRYLDGADIILAEGFSAHPLPKIEVFRRACGEQPLYDPARADAALWVAMITDTRTCCS
jgi:molybdopterin-guanine dinucleotide biosynthesis protein